VNRSNSDVSRSGRKPRTPALRAVACALMALPIAAALAVAVAQAAEAGHSVSGTVYEGGYYYESSTVRTVTTSNDAIFLSFTSLPSGGINWYLVNSRTGGALSYTHAFTNGGQQTLVSGVANGTLFQNDYAQHTFCDFDCGSYNFAGTETY
jgi:hypothetical protein